MELRQLRYFVTLAEVQFLGRAAADLAGSGTPPVLRAILLQLRAPRTALAAAHRTSPPATPVARGVPAPGYGC
jgi:hypothetical protein